MDNQHDEGKKSTKIYTLTDTSEDESEGDVPRRVWLEQAQHARDAPATPKTPDHAVPGPSGQTSYQRQTQTSPTAVESWKTLDSFLGKRHLETIKRNAEEIEAKNSRDPATKDMMTALNQILNNADKIEVKKSVEKYYNRRQSPPSPFPGTSGNWNDLPRPPNLSLLRALRESNIKLEKAIRRTNPHLNVAQSQHLGEFDFQRCCDEVPSAKDNKKKKRRKERVGSHSHERDERPSAPVASGPRRTTANRDHGPIPAKIRKLSHNVINPRELNRNEAGSGSVSAPSTNQEAELVKRTTLHEIFRNMPHNLYNNKNNVISPRESISNKPQFDLSASSVNTSVALEDSELPSNPTPSARAPQQAATPEAILVQETTTPEAQVDQPTENLIAQVAQASRTASHKLADDSNKNTKHEPKENNATQTELVMELQLNQSLLGLLECPVCLEWMEPPMVQCRRGHLVCNVCRTRMPRCPVCRASFTSVRNRAMEQVAEKLGFPCRYGCGAVALLRKRERHEASCLRRSYACPLLACADTAPMSYDAFKQHHQDQHPELLVFADKNTFLVNPCTTQQKDWIVFVHMQIFHVQFSTDSRNWGLNGSVTYFGPKKNARKYLYEISVAGNQNSGRLIYSRDTHSDLDMKTTGCMRGDTFFIPSDHALNFMRPERNTVLPFTVSIQPKDRGEVRGDCNTVN